MGGDTDNTQEVTQEQIDAQIASDEIQIKRGEMMAEMDASPAFQELFQTLFIDAWSTTQTMNMASNSREQDAKVFEKMKARGEFAHFCETIRQDAIAATENQIAYKEFLANQLELSQNQNASSDDIDPLN